MYTAYDSSSALQVQQKLLSDGSEQEKEDFAMPPGQEASMGSSAVSGRQARSQHNVRNKLGASEAQVRSARLSCDSHIVCT